MKNTDEMVNSLFERRDQYLAEQNKRHKTIMKVTTSVFSLCLVALIGFGVWRSGMFRHTPAQTDDPVTTPPQGAISIPAIELEDSSGHLSMIGCVVYKGGIYRDAGSYLGEDAQKIEPLLGEYLGHATGTLNEWSKQDDYAEEFASTYTGSVYAVKGYDTSFRVCIKQYAEGEDGEPILWILFLDRLNGITISKGEDIFEDRLHLQGRISSIQ